MKPIGVVAITLMQGLIWLTVASGPAWAAPDLGPQEVMSDMSVRLFAALDKAPVAARHNVAAVSNRLRVERSGWDSTFWALQNWYLEG